jgi:hypothetical protein
MPNVTGTSRGRPALLHVRRSIRRTRSAGMPSSSDCRDALVRRGHHVTVVHDVDAYNAFHRGPEPEPVVSDEGVEVIGLRSGVGALSPLLTQQTGRPILNGRRIASLVWDGTYDVVNFHNVSLVGGPGLFRLGGDAVTLYMAHEHWLICPMHVLWRHGRERCEKPECFRCTLHYRRPPQLWRETGLLEREIGRVDAIIAMSEFSRDMHRHRGFMREMEVLPYFLPDPETATCRRPWDRHRTSDRTSSSRGAWSDQGLQEVIPVFSLPGADLVMRRGR